MPKKRSRPSKPVDPTTAFARMRAAHTVRYRHLNTAERWKPGRLIRAEACEVVLEDARTSNTRTLSRTSYEFEVPVVGTKGATNWEPLE